MTLAVYHGNLEILKSSVSLQTYKLHVGRQMDSHNVHLRGKDLMEEVRILY